MRIDANIVGWLRLALFALCAGYLWRSGFSPRKNEPKGLFDRTLRIIGAVLVSAIVLYFLGSGLGFYGTNSN